MYLALLLKDRCEIRVGGGKFWVNVEGFPIKIHSLVDVALLPFDVSQIVEGIGVGGTHG